MKMNFDIMYKGMSIECFTTVSVDEAKKYVKARYKNKGAGCSLVHFEGDKRVTTKI
jgi:hypothetical protein